MKKNIKYRSNNNYNNNNNSHIFSLNYKFDSSSPAGKFSGTALDLIKRYNELAKESQGNGDYVEAEVFRQYAEHYRKIVTEINERKNEMNDRRTQQQNQIATENTVAANTNSEANAVAEEPQPQILNQAPATTEETAKVEAPAVEAPKRSFKVIEINAADSEKPVSKRGRPRLSAPRKPKIEAAAL